MEEQVKYNKNGSVKKIQQLKTHDRNAYQKEYMRNYIKIATECKCDICDGKYKSYNKYKHYNSKFHKLQNEIIVLRQKINLI